MFARCEIGFYLKNNECKLLPELDYNYYEEDGVEDIFNKQWKKITRTLISLLAVFAKLL